MKKNISIITSLTLACIVTLVRRGRSCSATPTCCIGTSPMKLFLIILLFTSHFSFSQDCDEGSLLQQPGIWSEGLKGSTSGISTTDLAAEKKIVTALHSMIKSKYIPMGVRADFGGAYESPLSTMPVNGYSYNIYPLNFYCEGRSLKTADETSTYFSIRANDFDAEIYDNAPDDNLLGYFSMRDMPIEKDGYYYFKETDTSLGLGATGKRGLWLITYDGKLPFAYTSKKEFLLKRKQVLSDQMVQSASSSKDVLNNLEIEKKFKEAEFKNDPARLEKYMKMDYLPGKERYEKLLAENEKMYKPAFDKVEAQLKLPAAELNQPAIVKMDPNDGLSYLFTDDNDPFGQILIKPNPLYFKKLARSSPQFFTVHLTYNPKDPIAKKTATDIMNAIDFAQLKNLLGK